LLTTIDCLFEGLNSGQYLGQIQIYGYGSFFDNLGFCLQMSPSSPYIMVRMSLTDLSHLASNHPWMVYARVDKILAVYIQVNSNSQSGYLQCTPSVGSSGNFFTAYPLGESLIAAV